MRCSRGTCGGLPGGNNAPTPLQCTMSTNAPCLRGKLHEDSVPNIALGRRVSRRGPRRRGGLPRPANPA
eukprot:11189085-Lingulodinium_polyedra.AAC.1